MDERNWTRLSRWLEITGIFNTEVWCGGRWHAVGDSIRLRPTTWSVMLRLVGVSRVPCLQEFLADPLLHERPTWCRFDRWKLFKLRQVDEEEQQVDEEERQPLRRSTRARVATIKYSATRESKTE